MREKLLVRLDSGNDAAENTGILLKEGCRFIIKRNLRRERKEEWFAMAQKYCQNITHPREGKSFTAALISAKAVCFGCH